MKTVKLNRNSSVVYGRSSQCGIQVPGMYTCVSRCQCVITLMEGKGVVITDLFSANGTELVVDGMGKLLRQGESKMISLNTKEVILMPITLSG